MAAKVLFMSSAKEELRMHGEDRIIQMCTRSALSFRLRMSDRSLANQFACVKRLLNIIVGAKLE